MSAARTSARLLALYPPAWRDRYGDELADLIVEASDGRRVPWRMRADVVLGAFRERLRAAGLAGEGPANERALGGVVLVLRAWALFVIAGAAVQKLSEHWQEATPATQRTLPASAFDVLVVAAVCATALVITAIALTAPALGRFLRAGGWQAIGRRVAVAAALTVALLAATIALVAWAHGLSPRRRDGGDLGYSIAFVAWAALLVTCLVAWTAVAATTARRLALAPKTLRLEVGLAVAVTIAMAIMTAATVVWWAALGDAAPWFLAGRPAGASASPLAPELIVAAAAMLVATSLAAAGSRRAVRAVRAP